jgi:hypothetical protein
MRLDDRSSDYAYAEVDNPLAGATGPDALERPSDWPGMW